MGFDWFNFFTYKILKMDEITVCAERNASVEFRIYYLPFIRVKLCSNFVKIILNDNLISKIKIEGKPAFLYFSWESALLDYLTCKLSLVVHSRLLTANSLNEVNSNIIRQ